MIHEAGIPKIFDVAIIGSGLSALSCALTLAKKSDSLLNIAIVSKEDLGTDGASSLAQGGIAISMGEDDSITSHLEDTINVGGGLSDLSVAESLINESKSVLGFLEENGISFDREISGDYQLGREGGHSHHRILHINGDSTGSGIMNVLTQQILKQSNVFTYIPYFLRDLKVDSQQPHTLFLQKKNDSCVESLEAENVVFASGGIGQLFSHTTSPYGITGEVHALFARSGGVLRDMEFVQFHPTSIDILEPGSQNKFDLASEALRGAGAKLLNNHGERFLFNLLPEQWLSSLELAPRDIIAQAIEVERKKGHRVFLDCRMKSLGLTTPLSKRFPKVNLLAKKHGIDIDHELLPVSPAVHYHMGGISIDVNGKTSVERIWACGEVACNGFHGGNRLASNSLLEAVIMGKRVALAIENSKRLKKYEKAENLPTFPMPFLPIDKKLQAEMKQVMTDLVGIIRNKVSLANAYKQLIVLHNRAKNTALELQLETALFITLSALKREETRGSHYRDDFPKSSAEPVSSFVKYNDLFFNSKDVL